MESCRQIILMTSLLLLALTACQTQPQMQLREGFGDAVKTNVALHVIDPEAGKQEPVVPDLEGPKVEQVLEQYRKPPEKVKDETLIESL